MSNLLQWELDSDECEFFMRKEKDGFTAPELVAQARMNYLMHGYDPDIWVRTGDRVVVKQYVFAQRWMEVLEPCIYEVMTQVDTLQFEMNEAKVKNRAKLVVLNKRSVDLAKEMASLSYSYFRAKEDDLKRKTFIDPDTDMDLWDIIAAENGGMDIREDIERHFKAEETAKKWMAMSESERSAEIDRIFLEIRAQNDAQAQATWDRIEREKVEAGAGAEKGGE